jgi:hypothetical protein
MLRFDLPPIWSNAARVDALITFTISAIALLGFPRLMPLLAIQGLVRGFFGHRYCPSHRLVTLLLKKPDMPAKRKMPAPRCSQTKSCSSPALQQALF